MEIIDTRRPLIAALASLILVGGALAGCASSPTAEPADSMDDDTTTETGDSGSDDTAADGDVSASLQINGITTDFIDTGEAFGGCLAIGPIVSGVMKADDDSGAMLFFNFVDPNVDPGDADVSDPYVIYETADGEEWGAGAADMGLGIMDPSTIPLDLIPNGRSASGTITLGQMDPNGSGEVVATTMALIEVHC